MIYCVVPQRAVPRSSIPKLTEHYENDDNVTVIVDRRESDRRAARRRVRADAVKQRRVVRDRRRARVPGDLPPLARAL